ncbi:MAG: CpsD/CapB family tyrosine-protein kinase, partial [Steroidobacteraceae bacterium]
PALVLSCLAATVLGLVRDTGDSSLRSERALYERIGIPCIAMVPKLRRRGRRSLQELLIDRPYCAYAEAIRFAAAGLGVAEACGPATVILVTSAVPGEGKTTFAVSLAAVAATMGKRVLLMDLDLRHPSVEREVAPGAPPHAPDETARSPAEVGVQPVPGLHFDIVASRRGTTNALRLFAGEDMASRIARLRRQYDCVIIDSAPLLAMAEVRLIARLADRVVVAVKWADTRADMVQNAVDLLHVPGQPPGQPPRNVFSVITQVDLKKHARQCAGDHAEIAMRYRSYYQALAG